MNILFIFTSSLFFLWIVRELFFWLSIWQTNEYRPDRFFLFIKRKKSKSFLVFSFLLVIKLLFFFGFALVIFDDRLLPQYQYGIVFLYLLQSFLIGREIYLNRLKKPRLTVRAILIILLSLFVIFSFFSFPLMDKFFWLLFIDLFTPFIISFFVFLFLFPIELYNDWQAETALKKLHENKQLLIIGVTGSHGKSMVKDYIADILRQKFRVVKTEKKDNTLVGIAKTILKKLEKDTEIFVVEMSAYKKGEISDLCRFIRPKIGIITGINNQYFSLFNGLENIIKTNNELVEGLPKNGICIFNGMSKHAYTLFKKSKKQKAIYFLDDVKSSVTQMYKEKGIMAFNIVKTAKRTTFDVKIKEKILHVTLHAPHSIEKLLPAIYIADKLKMSKADIKKALANLN